MAAGSAASSKVKKRSKAKKVTPQATATQRPLPVYAPIPTVIQLTKQAARLAWLQRRVLGGITLVYGLLSLLLVRGLSSGVDVAQLRDQVSNHVAGSLAAYVQLLGTGPGTANPAAGIYQVLLFIIASLALIWALRHLAAGETASVKEAYYRGMYPLVPFILLLLVIGLQLLPALIGVSVYQLVVLAGIAASTLEVVVWGLAALALSLLSLYLVVSSIVALYIVTLPGMMPLQALRSARQLVKGRRWTILRKVLFLPIVLLIGLGIVMVPFILVAPAAAEWLLFALGFAGVAAGHVYLYNLYQRLLDEQTVT